MKIVTWNLFIRSKQQIEAVNYALHELQADFLCLQEVSDNTLEYIKKLDTFYSTWCRAFSKRGEAGHTVLVSKQKPTRSRTLDVNSGKTTLLSKIYHLDYKNTGILSNDYVIDDKKIRMFGVHSPYGISPHGRLEFLKEALNNLSEDLNVICGDFNSFGYFPWIYLSGPLNGSNLKDFFTNELNAISKLTTSKELFMGSRDFKTFPMLNTQLDHIIVPKIWESGKYEVIDLCYGSDHKIVMFESG